METRPPAITVEVEVIPDRGKRPVPLRFRTQREVRKLIAAAARDMHLLPEGDDDEEEIALISLPESWMAQVTDATITDPDDEPSMTFAALIEAVNPMDRGQLRAVIASAWSEAPRAAEQAIADVQREQAILGTIPAAPRGGHPYPDVSGRVMAAMAMVAPDEAAAVLAESIAAAPPVIITEDEADEPLPDCGDCGHAENLHHRKGDEAIAHGRCWIHRCGCAAYTLDDAAPAATA